MAAFVSRERGRERVRRAGVQMVEIAEVRRKGEYTTLVRGFFPVSAFQCGNRGAPGFHRNGEKQREPKNGDWNRQDAEDAKKNAKFWKNTASPSR